MKILKYLMVSLVVLAGLAGGALGWLLGTQGGRDWLVERVNGVTATMETPVVLGRLTGRVLSDVELDSVTVADGQGVWLEVGGIRLVWRPVALWRGEAPFELLEIAKVRVLRRPVVEAAAEEDSGGMVRPLDYLVYVPRRVKLEDVVVEAPVTGLRHRLTVEVAGRERVQGIRVETLEGPVTEVSGTVDVVAQRADVRLREEPRGLLGGLLKLPEASGLEAEVVGDIRQDVVTLEKAQVVAGGTRVTAQGTGTLDGRMVSGTAGIVVGSLRDLQGLLGVSATGQVEMAALVSGSLPELGIQVDVTRTAIGVDGVKLAALGARLKGVVDARDLERLPFDVALDGGARVSGVGRGVYPVQMQAAVSGTLAGFGSRVSATMVRAGERASVVAGGAVEVSPLQGQGTLEALWVQNGRRFAAQGGVAVDEAVAVLRGMRVTGPGVAVSLSGQVTRATLLAEGRGVVRITDLKPLGELVGAPLRGMMDADLAAAVKGDKQVADAAVRRLDVGYGEYRALMGGATRLVWDGGTGTLSPLAVEIYRGGAVAGRLTAQGSLNADVVDARLTLAGLDVETLTDSDVVTGKVDLNAMVRGRSAAPVAVVDGRLTGATGEYPLDMQVAGDWRGGKFVAKVTGNSRDANLKADVTVAGGLSVLPLKVGIDEGSRVNGVVEARVPLEMFNNLLWASRQQIGGLVEGRATVGGTLGAPDVGGRFGLSNGRYVQSTSGVCLRDVSAELVGNRNRIDLQNVVSRDGEGGSLTGRGSLGLQGAWPLEAEVRLAKLRLFCGGLASGMVDGELLARGTLADHMLSGDVTVGPLQVQLPGASNATEIPKVETVRVRAGQVDAGGMPMVTRLAVTVRAPQQIFVRGRGMDAEFGGTLVAGGTVDAPLLNGSLKALRGQYTLLDRTLLLADSAVNFEGAMPPSPYLDVKAKTSAQGTQITLNVTGPAAKPQLALTSDPALPQDEALALLLFGRKLANISAFEALKLAQATRVLAGLDGGEPGILDKARRTLGVDTLDIGTGEESGDVTVTTGKYLTDDIYLSVEQGAEPEDREIKTEIELLPSVTGNTTVDGVGNQSFGVEWRRDY